MTNSVLGQSVASILCDRFTYSMEFFPPRTQSRKASFEKHMTALEKLGIDFCSITYGAGGTTTELTPEYVVKLSSRFGVPAIAHLTCVEHDKQSLLKELDLFDQNGITNILALRGDPRENEVEKSRHEIPFAKDLVDILRTRSNYCIGVAAHVEGHIDNNENDFEYQAEKIRSADYAITQLFYNVELYEKYLEDLRIKGIETPIIPGILPLTDVGRVEKIVELSGASIPPMWIDLLSKYEMGSEDQRHAGEDLTTEMCEKLKEVGAPGLHFYTMNRADSVSAIFEKLR